MRSEGTTVVAVSGTPLHGGRINPFLYGGFIELLDDLVPGMWAEMLNDRCFEGIERRNPPYEYVGAPNVCDRAWEGTGAWEYDSEAPLIGSRSARLTAGVKGGATLSQSGLSVRAGMSYRFEGFLRRDAAAPRVKVRLMARNPDGSWTTLGSMPVSAPGQLWVKRRVSIPCTGTTDRAVFEIEASGSGRVWVDKLSLMPSDNLDGWRADVVAAVKDARPGLIRWGGSVVDPGGYKWKNGIGNRDQRVPFRNVPWGRIDSNDVGLDEFLRFCELVDARPLVCVSFTDGPRNAKDLVAYCNADPGTEWGGLRARNGHPEPYRVRYWQIGNELGDEEYVKGCAAICRAIKESDPGAVLLSSYPSAELLAATGAYLDYVCPHHYSFDLGQDAASIDSTVALIARAGIDHEVRIGVTEWNVTGGSWGNERGRLLSLETGLFAGQYLNLLHRRSDVVGLACRSNMTNSLGSGMIQTTPAGLLLTPGYHVMRLYARHTLPVPMAVTGAPEGVDASACASEDRGRLVVFLVNARKEPVELRLDAEAAGAVPVAAWVVCDTEDARLPDLMNHGEAPDRVRTVELPLGGAVVRLPALSVAAVECAAG